MLNVHAQSGCCRTQTELTSFFFRREEFSFSPSIGGGALSRCRTDLHEIEV
jgi:hypothetical protein